MTVTHPLGMRQRFHQGKLGSRDLRLSAGRALAAILLLVVFASPTRAETCLAPMRPFVPNDAASVREYADLIRADFELYIRDIQAYFRCLEAERARAFEEAREVSEEYGRFLQSVGD